MNGKMAEAYFQFGRNSAATEAKFRLGCWQDAPLSDEGAAYTHYLSHLLSERTESKDGVSSLAADEGSELDLLLYWEPERPWWQRWLGWTPAIGVVERSPASVLVVRRPRWPLRRILLILRADVTDEAAIQWVGQLARSERVELFVLPIIPPFPAMYSHGIVPLKAEVVLAPNTFSGAQMRRLISLCAAWGVEAQLLLHDSEPQRSIEWAARTSDCNLVLLSHEPHHWLHHRFLGELVRPLLRRADRPVLIAKNLPEKSFR